jgi:zinc/manganese transport system ATP-binding protein
MGVDGVQRHMAGRAPDVLIDDLTVAYERHPALHHVSGVFRSGSLTAVVGPNGAGKSTLLKAIAGIVRPVEGRVRCGDRARCRDEVALLPQQAEIEREFPVTVLDAVSLGHWRRVGWFRAIPPRLYDAAGEAIERVGLGGMADRRVGTLSAGQFQRMLFARLMLQEAPIILLDEPFAAIDAQTALDLLDLVDDWHAREGRTVIAVLHDLPQVRAHFPETVLLARACIAWGPTAEVLNSDNLWRAGGMGAGLWDDASDTCRRGAVAAGGMTR